jgi:hypothetical protein
MDHRIDALATEHRTDARFLFRLYLGSVAGLLAVMAALFWRINDIAVQVARALGH